MSNQPNAALVPDFMPDAPRAGAVDLAAAIKKSRDRSNSREKVEELGLRAEVHVPGIHNGKGWGVVLEVKKFTGLEAGQLVWKTRQAAELDDPELYKNVKELSSAGARESWWTDTWRLIYGCTDETKRVLAALATGQTNATAAMFGIEEAQYWLTCPESGMVAEPLLQAIIVLNYYAKDPVKTTSQLDEFKALPDTLEQLIVAYRSGTLKEWMMGNPEVVGFVTDNVKMLQELMDMVDDKRERRMAHYFKDAAQQAVREVVMEWFGKDMPLPRQDSSLYQTPAYEDDGGTLEREMARANHGGGPQMVTLADVASEKLSGGLLGAEIIPAIQEERGPEGAEEHESPHEPLNTSALDALNNGA